MILDTRRKILTLEQAADKAHDLRRQGETVVAFVSHLEVLHAAQVERLQEVAVANPGKLFVVLTETESPLVALAARAEVAAALRVVDYVVPCPDGAGPALAAIGAALTVDDEEADRGRTRQLIEHVRSRAGN